MIKWNTTFKPRCIWETPQFFSIFTVTREADRRLVRFHFNVMRFKQHGNFFKRSEKTSDRELLSILLRLGGCPHDSAVEKGNLSYSRQQNDKRTKKHS